MPVLPLETSRFPGHLFDLDGANHYVSDRQWCVLHTRPRQEKSLARDLCHRETPFYLPLVPRRMKLRGRVVTSFNPLFPGYVFLLANTGERSAALATRRIAQSLPAPDPDQLWSDLRQIQQLLACGASITPVERFAAGAKVKIRSGPLAGLEGTILRAASGNRFEIRVNFIQRGASVLLDDCALEEIN